MNTQSILSSGTAFGWRRRWRRANSIIIISISGMQCLPSARFLEHVYSHSISMPITRDRTQEIIVRSHLSVSLVGWLSILNEDD